MRTGARGDSDNKSYMKIGAAVVVAALAIGVVWWALSQRVTATPEEIAKSHIDDNIDAFSEEIAGFMAFEAPILSTLARELGGEYLEGLIQDVVKWDYSAERSDDDDDIYEVTATARVNLSLDVEGLVDGYIEVALPFLVIVDMDEQSVRRSSPQLADASFSTNLLDLPGIAALNNVLPSVDKLDSVVAKATDVVSKISPPAVQSAAQQTSPSPAQSVGAPEKAVESADSLENCVFAALGNDFSGILIEKIEETNPQTLTDKQRWEWFKVLSDKSGLLIPCQDLWSEPITMENADKRNEELYYDECFGEYNLERDENYSFPYDSIRYKHTADVLELLERPYHSLSVTDKVTLRMIFSRNPGSEYISDYDVDIDCAYYYPQLFFGRWIPIFER